MKKKCPACGSKAIRLYKNSVLDGKRQWVPIGWHCPNCSHTYTIASDTLIYTIGGKQYNPSFRELCPNCGLKLVRSYRHKNPKHGKQEWISLGWYCNRCRYIWMDEPPIQQPK